MANVKLGTKAVGDIVKLKVNGTAKEFIVVHQGKPSSIYDESCNGTWLLMKDIYENRQWNSSDVNVLETSAIHRYLNSTFLGLFDSDIQGFIKQVKIPYRKGGGSNGTTQQGENGLPCKIFLLSAPEVHYENMFIYSGEGAALSYFASCATNTSDSKRIAYLNGSATAWWLRSLIVSYIELAWLVYPNGNCNSVSVSNSYGIRPVLILPQDMEVDSSGNVTPPPPATHKTLIGGTAYEVKGGKCLVNGTAYSIKKGRTLVGGTGYDITLPGVVTRVSTLRVGQSVYAKVNGVAKEFIIVHQGKPSSIYDESCDGTWLLMKDIYEKQQWHSDNYNVYEISTVNTYLNGPFLGMFDSYIQGVIKQVKIPYRKGGGSNGTDQSGANGLPAKIFLLSGYEVGWTTNDNPNFPVDGAKLDYFESGTGSSANNKRIAKLNGSAADWWLRSPLTNSTYYVTYASHNGDFNGSYPVYSSYGIRPALVLRSDALVDDEFNIIS